MRTSGPISALLLVLFLAGCGGTSHRTGTTGASAPPAATVVGPTPAANLLLPPAIKSAGVLRIAIGPSPGDAALARRVAKKLGVRPALQPAATAAAALGDVAARRADVSVARGAKRGGVMFVDRARGIAVAHGAAPLAAAVRFALAAP